MRITRLFLRNYRVYEDALELEIPPGLVGIYGVNGAGKSALLESVLFTLWGRARTSKDEVRTSGVNGDCITEVEFEHEGHLYVVRRTISGANNTVKASAMADGAQVSDGVRDTATYVHSVLGMDDAAFRSSVFAEQKQLAAFSNQRPGERRDLVLKLLGVTPLDLARDTARKDARVAREQLEHLKSVLPSLDELQVAVDDARARADAATAEAATEEAAATVARERADDLVAKYEALDEVRREYERLVAEGKTVRKEHDDASKRVEALEAELTELDKAQAALAELAPLAAGLADAERELKAVETVVAADAAVAKIVVPPEPEPLDEEACETARAEAESAASSVAELNGQLSGARERVSLAEDAVTRSEALSGEGDCPLCGQALGDAFEQVQSHRARELAEARTRLEALETEHKAATKRAAAAKEDAEQLVRSLKERQAAWKAYDASAARRAESVAVLEQARAALGRTPEPGEAERLTADVRSRREAADEASRLAGRLERRAVAERDLETEKSRLAAATGQLETLRDKVKALGFKPEALAQLRAERDDARGKADVQATKAQQAMLTAERARSHADAEAKRLADAEEQHAKLTDVADTSRHLNRLADLLNAFRNGVVASVGPRLAAQAADLFAELTDHEYDRLEVDADTYEIKIRDAGLLYGMDRFSGSEIDLANLALRIAISEHVRFQSGGAVGLLVLDEVFGPLDEDRKERTLLALERLRSRFRQVLVVTHDSEIKEQLPNAIEVVKLPGRRATARVLN